MFELVYRSIAAENISLADIEDILFEARYFNGVNDITGCLLFFNNEFVQILEGKQETVLNLYKKIEKDRRHTNVLLLNSGEKTEKVFPDWTMAYYDLNDINLNEKDRLQFIRNYVPTLGTKVNQNDTVRLFWHIVKELVGPWSLDDYL